MTIGSKKNDFSNQSKFYVYKCLDSWYLEANGLCFFDDPKKFPREIQEELKKAKIKREEMADSFTVDEWREMFKKAPNGPVKGYYKKRILALGGTIDDLI